MSKTILARVDGWTPLIDHITQEYGVITAAVFGRVWRYCQGEAGVCFASLETIANELGIDKGTVQRHIKKLVIKEYLEDLTPDVVKAPHTYRDTGKIGVEIEIKSVAQNNRSKNQSVAQNNRLDESVAHNNTSVAENISKIQVRDNVLIDNESKGENDMRTAEECRASTEAALMRSYQRTGPDLSNWPADIQDIVGTFCELWNIRPPKFTRRKGGPAAFWIEAARDLSESCGEFGVEALRDYRRAFKNYMDTHNGLSPLDSVSSPKSLVNVIRGHTGKMRDALAKKNGNNGGSAPLVVNLASGQQIETTASEVYTSAGRLR